MRAEHWRYTIPLRLRSLFRRAAVEQDLDEELRYHLEQLTERNLAGGMTPEAARLAARRAMDGIEQRKEERSATTVPLILDAFRVYERVGEIRNTLRGVRRVPGEFRVSRARGEAPALPAFWRANLVRGKGIA